MAQREVESFERLVLLLKPSAVLDTDQRCSAMLNTPGTCDYFC